MGRTRNEPCGLGHRASPALTLRARLQVLSGSMLGCYRRLPQPRPYVARLLLVSGVHSKGVSNDRANRPLEDPIESSCPILDLSGAAVSLHSCTNRPFCLAITVRARCRPELPVPWLI